MHAFVVYVGGKGRPDWMKTWENVCFDSYGSVKNPEASNPWDNWHSCYPCGQGSRWVAKLLSGGMNVCRRLICAKISKCSFLLLDVHSLRLLPTDTPTPLLHLINALRLWVAVVTIRDPYPISLLCMGVTVFFFFFFGFFKNPAPGLGEWGF